MRFLVDECTGTSVSRWLRTQNHEVFSVYEEARGMRDQEIIEKAFVESWILITNDKDFGEKIYRENYPHRGIIFMRLENERSANKIETLQRLLANYTEQLKDSFVVVTEDKVTICEKLGKWGKGKPENVTKLTEILPQRTVMLEISDSSLESVDCPNEITEVKYG